MMQEVARYCGISGRDSAARTIKRFGGRNFDQGRQWGADPRRERGKCRSSAASSVPGSRRPSVGSGFEGLPVVALSYRQHPPTSFSCLCAGLRSGAMPLGDAPDECCEAGKGQAQSVSVGWRTALTVRILDRARRRGEHISQQMRPYSAALIARALHICASVFVRLWDPDLHRHCRVAVMEPAESQPSHSPCAG